ncbi:hypothetical protein L0337_21830 [candidate division KSB1 bacterium]|nr:hypothetical protein [candidate division KSB1 bacterium]
MSTKVRLYWKTKLDRLHLANGVHVRIIRLYVPVSFKEAADWSDPVNAIIDIGSPLTVLPKRVWQTMQNIEYLFIRRTKLFCRCSTLFDDGQVAIFTERNFLKLPNMFFILANKCQADEAVS